MTPDSQDAMQRALEAMRNRQPPGVKPSDLPTVLDSINQQSPSIKEIREANFRSYEAISKGEHREEKPEPVKPVIQDTAPPQSSGGSLRIPKVKPFIVTEVTQSLLHTADKLSATGRNVNILLTGQHGTGKSELAQQYAATRNRPFVQIDCGGLTEAFQLFGRMNLRNGETVYQRGLFLEAIATPNAVIHLQEINRAESDRALNALFSILDDTTRSLWIEELGEYATVAPGVTFFASLNEGYQYIGTMPLDEALRNRFLIKITLKPLDRVHEERLLFQRFGLNPVPNRPLHDMVERIRHQNPDSYLSTRDLVTMGELVSVGLSPAMALRAVIGTDDEVLESILLSEHFAGQQVERLSDDWQILQ